MNPSLGLCDVTLTSQAEEKDYLIQPHERIKAVITLI